MDDRGFPQQLHAIGVRAVAQAVLRGAAAVEAEHILLALAADSAGAAAQALAAVGLDYDALGAALDAERARSLAVVGIATVDAAYRSPTPRGGRPGWGASVREAIGVLRALPAKDRRTRVLEVELLIGVLHAELGTVPRALGIAGIDRAALVERLRRP